MLDAQCKQGADLLQGVLLGLSHQNFRSFDLRSVQFSQQEELHLHLSSTKFAKSAA